MEGSESSALRVTHGLDDYYRADEKGFEESNVLSSCQTLDFIWPNKKFMYEMRATTTAALQKVDTPAATPIAKVRPYQAHVTDCVDDKKRLAELFQQQSAPEYRDIAPTLVTCHPNDDDITTPLSLSPCGSPSGCFLSSTEGAFRARVYTASPWNNLLHGGQPQTQGCVRTL